jgi:ankyrin repeat protein
VNSKWLDDWTPLHIAANEGHKEVLTMLLSSQQLVDINARSTMMRTPLHQAALKSQYGAVVTLINHDADINPIDDDGNTPLHLAAMHGHLNLVSFLVGKFPWLVKNNLGLTAIDMAATYDVYSLIKGYAKSVLASTRSLYCRLPFNTVLLHNSRRDAVQRLMDTCNSKPPTDKALDLL